MKLTTYNSSKPKLSKQAINRKDTQTRSTLNSGRSSTHTNKRHSHEFTHPTQILKNLNKSTTLSLTSNPQAQPSNISHKVIHENFTFHNNLKPQLKDKKNAQNCMNMKKVKETQKKYPSKNKINDSSCEKTDVQKFHSHRESLVMDKGISNRVNSEQKENICSNLPLRDIHKLHEQDQKISLGKLSFILDKDFKQKSSLTKKKLLLSSECPPKHHMNRHDIQQKFIKQKSALKHKQKQDETRSTSNSIKQSKKSIGSGRSHTIEKKKETLRYIKTKQGSSYLPQQAKQYLKLKSPSDLPQTEVVKEDKTYSIKSLLKALIDSSSDKERNQQHNIRKIIDCLTTNDNEPLENENITKGSVDKKTCDSHNEEKHSQQTQLSRSPFIRIESKINGFELNQSHNQITANQQNIEHSHLTKTIKRYELKIMQLYEQLIEEKEKRYKLQEMIEEYILQKEYQKCRN